jgi:hypothetical protein
MEPTENIKQAIDAARAGDIQFASRLLARIVAETPENDVAWLWLAASLDQPGQQMYCLQKAKAINPANPGTIAELEAFLFPNEPSGQAPNDQPIELPASSPVVSDAPIAQESVSIPMPPPREPIPAYQPPEENATTKRGSNRRLVTIVILLALAILVVVIALAWFVISSNPQLLPPVLRNLIQSGGIILALY